MRVLTEQEAEQERMERYRALLIGATIRSVEKEEFWPNLSALVITATKDGKSLSVSAFEHVLTVSVEEPDEESEGI